MIENISGSKFKSEKKNMLLLYHCFIINIFQSLSQAVWMSAFAFVQIRTCNAC